MSNSYLIVYLSKTGDLLQKTLSRYISTNILGFAVQQKEAKVIQSAFKLNCNNTLNEVISRLQATVLDSDSGDDNLLSSVKTICKGYIDETIVSPAIRSWCSTSIALVLVTAKECVVPCEDLATDLKQHSYFCITKCCCFFADDESPRPFKHNRAGENPIPPSQATKHPSRFIAWSHCRKTKPSHLQ